GSRRLSRIDGASGATRHQDIAGGVDRDRGDVVHRVAELQRPDDLPNRAQLADERPFGRTACAGQRAERSPDYVDVSLIVGGDAGTVIFVRRTELTAPNHL